MAGVSGTKTKFEELGRSLAEGMKSAWLAREFPLAAWQALGRTDLLGMMNVSKEQSLDILPHAAAAFEGFAKGSFDCGFVVPVLVHAFLGVPVIHRYGSPLLRVRVMRGLINGDFILAFAVTEPHGGSRALNPQTKLRRKTDSHYILSGEKWHITNAPNCTHILAWAEHPTDPMELVAVAVDAKAPGVFRERISTLATSSSSVGKILFNEVDVNGDDVCFLTGGGKRVLQELLIMERAMGVFPAVGLLERMIESSVEFANNREVAGEAIFKHQHVQRRISDMVLRLETLRPLSQALLQKIVSGQDPTLLASVAKISAVRYVMDSAIDAAQLGGTYGLLSDAQFPMILLDALGCSVGGGTEEIHRNTIIRWVQRNSRKGLYGGAAKPSAGKKKESNIV